MERETAMKILKELHGKSLFAERTALETLIPELKESEDERIKRNIIAALKGVGYYDCDLTDECIAWLEKQGKKQPIIVWHSINEEPEEMKELFCEWESDDATCHDVAFYVKESHTFYHAKMPINVTKWIYVDELLEKQGEQKSIEENNGNNRGISSNSTWSDEDEIEIPFGAKDSELIEERYYISKGCYVEVRDRYVAIKKDEKPAAWSEEDSKIIDYICDFIWKNRKGDTDEIYQQEQDVKWLKSLKQRLGGK